MPSPRAGDGNHVTLRNMELRVARSLGLGLLLAGATLVSSAGSESSPPVVTTDSPEYCQKLLERLGQAIHTATEPPPVEVSSLSSEGQRMCNDGLTRGGVLRLRRALLILEQAAPAP
jgi:hypothetical protein